MINENLLEEIKIYCDLNKIEDVDQFINRLLSKAFALEKYGDKPTKKPVVTPVVEEKKETTPITEPIKQSEPIRSVDTKRDLYGE